MLRYTYLFIDLFSLAGPLALSFDHKVAFYKNWKALFISIFCMSFIFIPWDVAKTAKGVWGFNSDYLTGIYFFNLPLEECLFFICIPYACIFIYECMNAYVKTDILHQIHRPLLLGLAFSLIFIGIYNYDKWYAAITFPYAGILLLSMIYIFRCNYLGRFFTAYLVTLLPFLLVNGILTGSFIQEPIVWYSTDEIFNIRIGTIPVEDTIYNLSMLGTVVLFYEYLKKRKAIT